MNRVTADLVQGLKDHILDIEYTLELIKDKLEDLDKALQVKSFLETSNPPDDSL